MEEKKIFKQNENKLFEHQNIEIAEVELKFQCPHCNSNNEKEAIFCCECGKSLQKQKKCPKCGSSIPVEANKADICEKCGEWLLEGQCKFCYSELENGASFCSVCGNPVAGIICSKCGKLSYFDYCKYCNIPLTEIAKKELEELKNDPEQKEFLKLLEINFSDIDIITTNDAGTADNKLNQPDKEALIQLKQYTEKVKENEKIETKMSVSFFSEQQKNNILNSGKIASEEIKKQEEERRRIEEEKRIKLEEEKKRKEEERKRLKEEKRKLAEEAKKLRNKTFRDNQEARRFFSKYKPKKVKGWICNCYDVMHNCPEECSAPEGGGYWVVD